MNAKDLAIDVRGLTKIYDDRRVVDHINLSVPKGKIYGFLGANGSGKTTTIRMLCGLLTPDEGEGTCLGFDLRLQSELIKRNVGYMTQKFSYWEDLTIRENLEFTVGMFGLDRPKARVNEALEKLNLTKRQKQLAGNLSGGWKQRMALAASILHEPQLLLLDEPTAGVDPKARREFWDEIHTLASEGLTVLVTTHYMDEAERCHAIIYMNAGRIITQGTIAEVVQEAKLITWAARGENLIPLMRKLEQSPGVATVAPFGDSLHVSGTDREALEMAIMPYFHDHSGISWALLEPSMEDVFIHYLSSKESESA